MKRKDLTDGEKRGILERLAQIPRPSQELVAEETHHGKLKIGRALKEFYSLTWEEACALCNNNQRILALRPDYIAQRTLELQKDYIDRKIVEPEELEQMWDNITTLRMEQGLPFIGIRRRQ